MISGQNDLFGDLPGEEEETAARGRGKKARDARGHEPLAARLRPETIDDFVGQEHILGKDSSLRRDLEAGRCSSMILWGPPGSGKTTLAGIFARAVKARVERLSAVTAGVKDIRAAIEQARLNLSAGIRTVLFVDEVHRFNKSQQDAFLPYIEDGTIIFIGATTENPSFELNSALLSRARVYVLKALGRDDILRIVRRAAASPLGPGGGNVAFGEGVEDAIARLAEGDARRALNILELAAELAETDGEGRKVVTMANLAAVGTERIAKYDKRGDDFFDLISAFHKSVRGSSPQAALYWFARIVAGGGDPLYVARRLVAIATEDIGTADPQAMSVALAAWDCFERVGPAEGERAIAEAAVYCAAAPKSNALYMSWHAVKRFVKENPDYDVPMYLRNAPTDLMKELGFHKGYRYAHDEPGAYAAGECFLPPEIRHEQWYVPSDRGYEQYIGKKLAYLRQRDEQSDNQRYPEDFPPKK